MPTENALRALTDETRALSAVLHDLAPADLARATNCPPWDLQELIVHIAASIRLPEGPFAAAAPDDQPRSAADYYRRPERDTAAYRQDNVDRTAELTRAVVAQTPAVVWYEETATHTIAGLGDQDLAAAVLIPGRGAMVLADWVATRVVAVAAHGLDVAITLGREPWTSLSALQVLSPLFIDLLGSPLPGGLHWDDRTLLATATGRRTLTADEVGILGPHAARFPLLS